MVLEAQKHGCVREAMIITSALSIQDPRERPMDKQQASDEKHRRFHDKESDFLAFVNLWNYLGEQQKALSSNAFRRLCRTDYLNYLRVREWQDIYTQLRLSLIHILMRRPTTAAIPPLMVRVRPELKSRVTTRW